MKKTNSFKLAMVAVGMLTIGTVSAQQTDATNADLVKQADAKVVKSVDNKGTIKYVQSANGLTQVTDAATNVTTFQLGGTLVAPTTITADAVGGKALNIEGIAGVSAADMVGADVNLKPAATFNTAGLTLMVRDETTGEIKKLLAADVAAYLETLAKNVYEEKVLNAAPADADYIFTPADLPIAALLKPARLFVYRNGVKLRQSDLILTTDGEVTIDKTKVTLFDEDVIELQYTN
ncbi:hypothetical protein [Tenacibaculum finnmarkense]|uniref:hypothetical protein n=1 Tax=Tenacibaculum finnmarkense TaxID=2781243 RepID=UPI00187B1F94|nr:hypothetical protein [Tenacibaculum finnmarkense]MBE7659923.1 hypothetical protein [Tenacibaculum finnmarkense genomovar finnmarkense]MCG8251609.1 hypothetical protein [Tenacibaculum finnmarkense genomovar finnmarkense]MCG8815137.1 hypothetical protein [Tenacibaculum finnmarkense]MCG8820063.1 hypothetical protein [Tenacibaculum finnmarkense]